jgi:N-acetylmuramoyl-L-alanine amidase
LLKGADVRTEFSFLTGLFLLFCGAQTVAAPLSLEKARLHRNHDPVALELCFNRTPEYFVKTPLQGKEFAIIFPGAGRNPAVNAPKPGGKIKTAKVWTAGGKTVVELFYTSTLYTSVASPPGETPKCLLIEASTTVPKSRPSPAKEESQQKTLEGGTKKAVLVPAPKTVGGEASSSIPTSKTMTSPAAVLPSVPVPPADPSKSQAIEPTGDLSHSNSTPLAPQETKPAKEATVPAPSAVKKDPEPTVLEPKPLEKGTSTSSTTTASVVSTTTASAVAAPPVVAVVVIDPGHGGQDPGAIGAGGTREKHITLAIAKKLAEEINAKPGMKAVLTRTDDRFLPLRDRMARARKEQAHVFLSIHADAAKNRTADGASVYILSDKGASSEAAQWLADRENAADLVGGVVLDDKDPTLASILLDVSQESTLEESVIAARSILYALDDVGAVHKREVQRAAFAVLKAPDVPSVLVETAFLSNPGEERKLKDTAYQQKLAEAISKGLANYFNKYPPSRRVRKDTNGNGAKP